MKPLESGSLFEIRGWPIFLAVLWGLGLGLLFISVFAIVVSNRGNLFQALVGICFLFGSLILFLTVRFLKNEIVIRLLQTLGFLVILVGGLSFQFDPDFFMAVPIAAFCLIVFWALNQLNGIILFFAFSSIVLTFELAGGTRILNDFFAFHDPNFGFRLFFKLLTSSVSLFPIFLVIFACVYTPRRVQFKRYFMPYRFRHYKPPEPLQPTPKSGFTLIEVLIAIALLSIITAGIMKVWGNTVRSVYDTEQRAQVATILSSEMNALMTAESLPAPSPDVYELPLAIDQFYPKKNLTGAYLIASTSQEQLVKIVVMVTQDIGGDAARHYRLESYRAVHQE